jgi:hypothetical protein
MPQEFSAEILSGSTNGLGVKVTGTDTSGAVTVHTAITGTTSFDLVELSVVNNDADGETRSLVIEWGGTTSPDNLIMLPVPCKAGLIEITPPGGLPLRDGLVIKAFTTTEANDVMVYGRVSRVTVT